MPSINGGAQTGNLVSTRNNANHRNLCPVRTRRRRVHDRGRRRRADVCERHAHARVHLRAVEQLPGSVRETARILFYADEFDEKNRENWQ